MYIVDFPLGEKDLIKLFKLKAPHSSPVHAICRNRRNVKRPELVGHQEQSTSLIALTLYHLYFALIKQVSKIYSIHVCGEVLIILGS